MIVSAALSGTAWRLRLHGGASEIALALLGSLAVTCWPDRPSWQRCWGWLRWTTLCPN